MEYCLCVGSSEWSAAWAAGNQCQIYLSQSTTRPQRRGHVKTTPGASHADSSLQGAPQLVIHRGHYSDMQLDSDRVQDMHCVCVCVCVSGGA